MKSLIMFSSLLFASGLYAAGEPDWCEVSLKRIILWSAGGSVVLSPAIIGEKPLV
jgi:hypothetical protein